MADTQAQGDLVALAEKCGAYISTFQFDDSRVRGVSLTADQLQAFAAALQGRGTQEVNPTARFHCNKCGYIGSSENHNQPQSSLFCYYVATPIPRSGTQEGEPSEWRPIETAPKDGTDLLVAVIDDGNVYEVGHGHFEVLSEDEDDGPWSLDGGEPTCSYVGRAEGTYFCCWLDGKEWESRWRVTDSFPYTHWMPMRALPARAALAQADAPRAGERTC